MLQFTKRIAATALALVMTVGISATAMAAEKKELQVQLNGENIAFTDAKPMLKKDRVYVPFRAVFEALDAKVSFDEVTKTITAVKDDKTIAFKIGDANVKITTNGKDEIVATDAPSFVDHARTLVPLRFAAQALGYKVGWDKEEQTAIIVDTAKVLGELDGKFTIMNKYLDYSREFSTEAYKFSGTFSFNMNVIKDFTAKETMPIKANGTISGITAEDKVNMNIAMKMDTAALKKLIAETETDVEEIAKSNEMMKNLENMKMDIIVDMSQGKYYISSPLFAMAGADANAWYVLDLEEMFSSIEKGFSFKDLYASSKSKNFEDYIATTMNMYTFKDVTEYKGFKEGMELLKGLLSDDAFKKENDTYVSSYTMKDNGNEMAFTMSLKEKDEKIIGYAMDLDISANDKKVVTMNATQNGTDGSAKMTMDIAPFVTASFDMNMKMEKTNEKALSKPADGSKIISIEDLMKAELDKPVTIAPEATVAPAIIAPEATVAPAITAPEATTTVTPEEVTTAPAAAVTPATTAPANQAA